jgi:hypothetical protein
VKADYARGNSIVIRDTFQERNLGGFMITFQEIVDSIEGLSMEDQEELFELIRKRRVEARRAEIAANAQEVFKAVEMGTAKRGSFEDLKAYLLTDENE